MKKINAKKFFSSILRSAMLVFSIIFLTSFLSGENLLKIKAAFGYGGGHGGPSYSPIIQNTPMGLRVVDVSAINYPMTLAANQEGFYTREIKGDGRIDLFVSKKTVSQKVTFDVAKTGVNSFNVIANGNTGDVVLNNEIIISYYTALPANVSRLHVYHFNENTNNWEQVSKVNFNTDADRVTIYTTKIGRFAVSALDLNQVRVFKSDTFVKDNRGRIYRITSSGKHHIRTISEFKSYRVKKLIKVDELELEDYPNV